MLALISVLEGRHWAIYPALGWGLGLAIHGDVVYLVTGGGGLYQRLVEQERERLSRSATRGKPRDGRGSSRSCAPTCSPRIVACPRPYRPKRSNAWPRSGPAPSWAGTSMPSSMCWSTCSSSRSRATASAAGPGRSSAAGMGPGTGAARRLRVHMPRRRRRAARAAGAKRARAVAARAATPLLSGCTDDEKRLDREVAAPVAGAGFLPGDRHHPVRLRAQSRLPAAPGRVALHRPHHLGRRRPGPPPVPVGARDRLAARDSPGSLWSSAASWTGYLFGSHLADHAVCVPTAGIGGPPVISGSRLAQLHPHHGAGRPGGQLLFLQHGPQRLPRAQDGRGAPARQ